MFNWLETYTGVRYDNKKQFDKVSRKSDGVTSRDVIFDFDVKMCWRQQKWKGCFFHRTLKCLCFWFFRLEQVDYKCLVFICLGNMYKQCTISKCPWECRSIKCPLCYSNIHIFVTLMIFMWFIGRKLTFCNHLLKLSFIDQEENSN